MAGVRDERHPKVAALFASFEGVDLDKLGDSALDQTYRKTYERRAREWLAVYDLVQRFPPVNRIPQGGG